MDPAKLITLQTDITSIAIASILNQYHYCRFLVLVNYPSQKYSFKDPNKTMVSQVLIDNMEMMKQWGHNFEELHHEMLIRSDYNHS